MTLNEFKAWQDGYVTAKNKKLTDKDYAAILKMLDEVRPDPCGCYHCRNPWVIYTAPTYTAPTYTAPVDISPTIRWTNSSDNLTLATHAGYSA